MADTSPGKVHALCAMFAQNDSLMGLMPPNGKLGARPWKRPIVSPSGESTPSPPSESEQNISAVSNSATRAILKILQQQDFTSKCESRTNFSCGITSRGPAEKPVVGPKPLHIQQKCRTFSSTLSNSSQALPSVDSCQHERLKDSHEKPGPKLCDQNSSESRVINEVQSFISHSYSNMIISDKSSIDDTTVSSEVSVKPIPKPRNSLNKSNDSCNNTISEQNVKNGFSDSKTNNPLSIINSDNYICKSRCKFVVNELPPKDKLGPPPLKPAKPSHLKLPEQFRTTSVTDSVATEQLSRQVVSYNVNAYSSQHKSAYSSPPPPRPSACPPPPPPSLSFDPCSSSEKSSKSLLEEIDELYGDTLLTKNTRRPPSLIPEYTVAEEEADLEELYDDGGDSSSHVTTSPCPKKPTHPPPPPPTAAYFDSAGNVISEELYQDADEPVDDEFYEEMPMDFLDEDPYTNNRKELEKLKRDKEKRLRKESKEKEKKEKEMEKVKKKFGPIGEEIPIDKGLVKSDCRGGRNDLQVSKGEIVYILRIEGNPVGKWLVRNKKGKYGYVELTNIEVDPNSVKSVMTFRRTSVISTSEELYSEAYSEQESIYETTY